MRRTMICILIGMGFAAAQQGSETDKQAMEAVIGRFTGAWNQHDAHAFAALFSEDAGFTNVRGTHVRGRTAVEEFHAPLFSGIFKGSHQTGQLRSVRFLKPDVAILDVDWEMTGATTAEGVARPPRKGLLNSAMIKTNGRWLIAVMHNTELIVEAIPAPGK
jgi:uncharacterized protein (TIGR02246 family)